ncbi:DUF6344 domain-containing protein [Streptomyces sp. NPDC101194]|uniref:DUF6344 domain-containing protein n=1 Tax=Streptomyces sp. NPDC101194 TaxID=3366127 RepID=UPI003810D2D5
MSTFKPKSIWTAFVTAFFALLAALGLMSSPATATEQSAPEPTTTNRKHTGATAATATAPSVRWTLPRDRALPPTTKQRIRAEAHGSSPAAARQPSTDTTNAMGARSAARATHGAPAGDVSLLPP